MRRINHILYAGLILFSTLTLTAQSLAFPGAEGFGKYTKGGRGGKILIVKNLNDDGEGSLRAALRERYPRIIIFNIGGTIQLKSELEIPYGFVSVLGQSAPGKGITLRDYPLRVDGQEQVIIRYIRSRLGDASSHQGDAISIVRSTNVIVDHCSFSWSVDETASFYDNEYSTIQYCMVTESLNSSVHAKGEHGYGGIWGGKKATFYRNLFAHHKSRNPRFHGARYHKQPELEVVDFTNNVIYNWKSNSSYGGEEGNHNIRNNYYKPGPATSSNEDRILDPYKPFGKFYISGNILEGNRAVSEDNWLGVKQEEYHKDILISDPIEVEETKMESAEIAYRDVLNQVGASYMQDVIDKRIIREVSNGTASNGDGIIDSQKEVESWPEKIYKHKRKDGDEDGIPDSWEKKHGLNPENPRDAELLTLQSTYSNIELYLNTMMVRLKEGYE